MVAIIAACDRNETERGTHAGRGAG
jgi:hypothetical protein